MSEAVRGVVVAHADLAEAFIRAAEGISGVFDALAPVSNDGVGPEELCRRVEEACGGGTAIIFCDLSSGSCAFAGRAVARGAAHRAVVTGVNLPMLLDFIFHRELALPELVERLVAKARSETGGRLIPGG